MRIKPKTIIACLIGTLICAGCEMVRKGAETIGDLQKVQQNVSKAVGADKVTVKLVNGKSLDVGLVNTPLKELPSDQKKAKAFEVAQVAFRTYPKASNLNQLNIAFVIQRTYVGVVNYTNTTDAFSFPISELSAAK
jgi:hypothetical protein